MNRSINDTNKGTNKGTNTETSPKYGKDDKETLCWNCKRALRNRETMCSWARDFTPVEGWRATKGNEYQIYNINTGQSEVTIGYCIEECPLFVQNSMFATYTEAVRVICKELDTSPSTFYRIPLKKIKLYEEKTGKKVPLWVKYRAKCGDR